MYTKCFHVKHVMEMEQDIEYASFNEHTIVTAQNCCVSCTTGI